MAFPFIFQANFEAGTNAEWDSEQDTGTLLDFPHYSDLARIPGMEVPFRGAYCMRWDSALTGDPLTGDTNDHTVTEGDMNIADTATAWLRFYLFIGNNFAATADDIFNIFEWQSTSSVVEACISLQITAATDIVEIAIADGTEASSGFVELPKGRWLAIEALFTVDVTPGTDGVLTLFVDRTQVQTVTGHNQSLAITHGVLGPQNMLATTTGTLLFDEFIFDDLQIFPIGRRFPETVAMIKTGHVFVGPGKINNITLIADDSANLDARIQLWDTDVANTDDYTALKMELGNTAAGEIVDPAGMPVDILKGAYLVMTVTAQDATGPRALVQIAHALHSVGAMKAYGIRRGGV